MKNEIGWRFPPTNGGIGAGYNDSGIAHFSGAPLSSLARETIQNSLDARMEQNEPVHVSFEFVFLKPTDVGRDDLIRAIRACKREIKKRHGGEQRTTSSRKEHLQRNDSLPTRV